MRIDLIDYTTSIINNLISISIIPVYWQCILPIYETGIAGILVVSYLDDCVFAIYGITVVYRLVHDDYIRYIIIEW